MVELQSILDRAVKSSCLVARRLFAAATLPLLFLALAFASPASADSTQTVRGHLPPAASRAEATGRLPGTNQMSITFGLPLRNPEGLTNLLAELYDPSSTNYRNFLTPEDFTTRFGPTESDYQAVKDFALAHGLRIKHAHSNRTLLSVTGAVADVEKALNVKMLTYVHPYEARSFYAPDSEPSLPAGLSVLHIAGLDNFVLPHPMSLKRSPFTSTIFATPSTSYTGSGQDGSFLGYDFRSAYVPGTTLTGTGQTVALVEFDGYYASDISSYESQAGLPSVSLTNILLDGFNGVPSDPDGNMEVSLDIEMLVAMAPGLSGIIVYEAPNDANVPDDMLNDMATANVAAQISSSWGFGIDANTEQIFLEYAAQGQSYLNASGDDGAFTAAEGSYTPSDDPNITSVGGTTLTTTGPGGSWVSETVWNWAPIQESASSGGASTTYSIPSWQQGISMTACQGSTSMRNIPDVALTADNIFVEAGNGQPMPGVGGTSAATPLWAGFLALVNQQNAAAGRSRIGFINPSVYTIGKSSQYTTLFHDITTGNNTNDSSPTLYYAVAGYDLCTGWGTPAGTNLINALAPLTNGPLITLAGTTLTTESCLPTNGAVDPGETVTFSVTLRNIGSAATTNLVVTLQPNAGVLSPSGPQTYGALPTGGGSVSMPFTFTASGACASSITLAFQLQDGIVNRGTLTTILPLGLAYSGTNFSQNFDSGFPAGWSTTASGAAGGWSVTGVISSSYPYCMSCPEVAGTGIGELISPSIPIGANNAQLTFKNCCSDYTNHCGGVLEIQIGTNAYADIIAAGGTFVSGGYNSFISSTNTANPFAGRQVWSGVTGGFNTTTVILPPAAAGQNVHLKWRLGSDTFSSYYGWYIDTVSIAENYFACCGDSADLALSQTASTNTVIAGHNLTYTLTVTNKGSQVAEGVSITNVLPGGVTFVSASSNGAYANGTVVWKVNSLSTNTISQFTVTVTPTVGGVITNTATVSAVTPDPNTSNQTASVVTTVVASPVISTQPTNQIALAGSNIVFQVTASGMPSPIYQWYFNGTNLAGANTNTLTLTNVQTSVQGVYFVTVTNMVGSATSAVANLTVAIKPAISLQPSNQTVLPGMPASFQAAGTGTPAPAYQWCLNGTNLGGATNSSLSFSSVQPGQAGSYSVRLSNLAGAVVSTTAVLNVTVPVPLLSLNLLGSNVTVSLTSLSNVNYTLQYKDSLTSTNWSATASPLAGTGNTISLQDPAPGPNARFYRVLCSW